MTIATPSSGQSAGDQRAPPSASLLPPSLITEHKQIRVLEETRKDHYFERGRDDGVYKQLLISTQFPLASQTVILQKRNHVDSREATVYNLFLRLIFEDTLEFNFLIGFNWFLTN